MGGGQSIGGMISCCVEHRARKEDATESPIWTVMVGDKVCSEGGCGTGLGQW